MLKIKKMINKLDIEAKKELKNKSYSEAINILKKIESLQLIIKDNKLAKKYLELLEREQLFHKNNTLYKDKNEILNHSYKEEEDKKILKEISYHNSRNSSYNKLIDINFKARTFILRRVTRLYVLDELTEAQLEDFKNKTLNINNWLNKKDYNIVSRFMLNDFLNLNDSFISYINNIKKFDIDVFIKKGGLEDYNKIKKELNNILNKKHVFKY